MDGINLRPIAVSSHPLRSYLLSSLLYFAGLHAAEGEPSAATSESFEIDDELFESEYVAIGESHDVDVQSWLDAFAVRLSYQVVTKLHGRVSEDEVRANKGTEHNRLVLLVRYQNAFGDGWLLQAGAHAKAYAIGDYEYDSINNKITTEARLNELFIQRSFERHTLRFGRQVVVWGEVTGNSVLDVVNVVELQDFSLVNVEDMRLSQLMFGWDYYRERLKLSGFLNLYPEFNPDPSPGSPLYQPEATLCEEVDRQELMFEVGLQSRWSLRGSDVSVMGAYLYENELSYGFSSEQVGAKVPLGNDYWLLGVSANRAVGALLLVADFSYSDGVMHNAISSGPRFSRHDNSRGGASFGIEYEVTPQQKFLLSVQLNTYTEQWSDERERVGAGTYGFYMFRYRGESYSGAKVINSTFRRSVDGSFFMGSVGLDYSLNDHWKLFSQIVYSDIELPFSAALEENVRFEFTLHYEF